MATITDHRGQVRDHRGSTVQPPAVQPPVVHPAPPVVHPPVIYPAPPASTPSPHPPIVTRPPHRPSRDEPPTPHRHHGDYVFVEGYDWWPRWYPYWDPYWYSYWQYLYDYYGGTDNPEYAEWARDAYLRSIAPQWGWL
jgi:hypothetical protein